ncbi:MAG TPA: AsmA-like C-terminal region-containing protein, partial [Terriglobales bacterium]|nr:AsmA-like C-terminal region-containing protein [Terriglobales bacterium]
SSASEKVDFGPVAIPIVVAGPRARKSSQNLRAEFGPFALERGRAAGAIARGWADRSEYTFTIAGDADIKRALRLARVCGLRSLHAMADGAAQLNLQIAGQWASGDGLAGFAAPQVTGSARLRSIRFDLRAGSEPVEIGSAEMQLSPNEVRVTKLNARAAGAVWRGSVEMPRGCGHPENCPVHFQLVTDQFSLGDANTWANPNPKNRPWYRVLADVQPAPSLLTRLWAFGRVSADHFVFHGITASQLSANIDVKAGKMEISSVEAGVLGGKHRGKWQADFSTKPPVCSGSGNLAEISLANVSNLMNDDWVEGTASTSYEIRGSCSADFWQSADATLHVNVADGTLPHVFLEENAGKLKIGKLSAQVRLHSGTIAVSDGELDSPEGKYSISGTATLKREINFKLARVPAGSGSAFTVSGTLAEPHVVPVNGAEQARLKP